MYNTQYYKRLSPAYNMKLCVTHRPSHQCEGELPALPVTSCVPVPVYHHRSAKRRVLSQPSARLVEVIP